MKRSAEFSPRFVGALALSTTAVLLAYYALQSVTESGRIYESRKTTLRELAALRDESVGLQSRLRLLEKNAKEPADAGDAARKILPSSSIAVTNLPDQTLISGWALRSVEISLTETTPNDTGRIVEYLENQVPPWRLAVFDYRSVTAEHGDARLVLQTIVRSAK